MRHHGVQGHVVAEQQLEVPASWLPCDEDAMPPDPQPGAAGRPLQHTREQRHGHDTVVVTGANDLCVEVRPDPNPMRKHPVSTLVRNALCIGQHDLLDSLAWD